jgi:hypothetical protein
VPEHGFIFYVGKIKRVKVLIGNDQDVERGNWMDIAKCSYKIVPVNYLAGTFSVNDLTEDACRF